jgi:hypothetical protein
MPTFFAQEETQTSHTKMKIGTTQCRLNNKTPTALEVLDALLGINDHSPVLDVNEPEE